MQAAEQIHLHDKPVWHVGDWFSNRPYEYCRAYFHHINGELGLHSSEFYELNIVTEGSARHIINETAYDAQRGSIYFIPPGVKHGYITNEDTSIFHALILPQFFEIYSQELRNLPGYMLLFEVDPYLRNEAHISLPIRLVHETYSTIRPTLQSLVRDQVSGYEGREVLKNASMIYLIGLLASFASNLKPNTTNTDINPNALQIARSMEYIRMNSNQHLTVELLAQNVCMARSTFMRNFSAIAGCTPMQFLLRCRMAQARRLLCYTNMPITNIALECGFYDTSHFIHAFLKHEGQTPSDYRALNYQSANYSVCTIC